MRPIDQQISILNKVNNVLRVIQNEPKFIVPSDVQPFLVDAIQDCLKAINIAKKEIVKFDEYFNKREKNASEKNAEEKKLQSDENYKKDFLEKDAKMQILKKKNFDAGLTLQSQMDFKYAIFSKCYDELAPFLEIPLKQNMDKDSESDNQFFEHYEGEHHLKEIPPYRQKDDSILYRFKEYIGDIFGHISKLKPFLSSASTLIASLALPYPILEQVNEVLKKLNIGITLSDSSYQLFKGSKNQEGK